MPPEKVEVPSISIPTSPEAIVPALVMPPANRAPKIAIALELPALTMLAESIRMPPPIKPLSKISPLMRLFVTVKGPVIVPELPTLPLKVVLITLIAVTVPAFV